MSVEPGKTTSRRSQRSQATTKDVATDEYFVDTGNHEDYFWEPQIRPTRQKPIVPRASRQYIPDVEEQETELWSPPPTLSKRERTATSASMPARKTASQPRLAPPSYNTNSYTTASHRSSQVTSASRSATNTAQASRNNHLTPSNALAAQPSRTTHITTSQPSTNNAKITQAPPPKRRRPLLLYLILGMIGTLLIWFAVQMAMGWINTWSDDYRYGRPRTFQTDAWVGHNEQQTHEKTHFVAINLNRHIQIIEIQGGDAAHSRIYNGPQLYGPNDDLTPVTLKFIDVNGDKKLDMIVYFQNSHAVFINEDDGFRPLKANEEDQVEQFLQNHKP